MIIRSLALERQGCPVRLHARACTAKVRQCGERGCISRAAALRARCRRDCQAMPLGTIAWRGRLAKKRCGLRAPFVYLPGGWLMSWHIRSVRARILLLVLVPVLSLFGLYLFTTGIAGKDALNLARARALKTATSEPVSNFLGQLDTERVFSAIYLSAPSPGNLAKLHAQEAATEHVTAALRAALPPGSTLG